MSRSSFKRTYPYRQHDYIPDYSLDSLFKPADLTIKLMIAEHRLMMAFDHAVYWSHGKLRGTDNFIVGVGHRQKDLVEHVIERIVEGMKSGIVTASDLPDFVGDTSSVLRRVARNAERRILAVRLEQLAGDGIWFDRQTPGTWNISQSMMDTYRSNKRMTAEASRIDTRLRREGLHSGGRLRVVH